MNLSGLAKKLLNEGAIAEEAIRNASDTAQKQKIPLVTYLVQNNLIPARTIALAASDEFGTPLIELDSMSPDAFPKELVAEKLIRKHRALPLFKRGTRLYVAVSDPTNLQALDEIKFNTGMSTEAVIVDEDKLDSAIDRYLESSDSGFSDLGDSDLDDLDIEAGVEEDKGNDVSAEAADDAPIVRFVNKILLDAIKMGASDIHFEPYEKAYRIRLRADGILREAARPPVNLATKLAARLKVMSQLDISERRVPQDGRIKLKLSKTRAIDFRVNTLPTLFGEKIVLRILDPDSAKLGIDMLGYEEDQKTLYMKALEQPQGMILVTGPTGSGKTVSLYTGLNILNTPERNISTAEDPAEINLEGVNQVNVNNKVGLNFGAALRAFLRQDPDVVMVGEIRDLETAEIAIKAAQTGHLVLSTLHTNSAPETLTRLRNMGVPAFNIATSVSLIIAQRLARRLCKHCKKPLDIPNDTLIAEGFKEEEVGTFTVYGPQGCDKCVNGYKGRVGIYEVVKVTDAISRIIMEEGNAIQIADSARQEGFNDLRTSGLKKVKDGLTSLEEVNRVTTGH
ncbi:MULTISPECIES: type IV-A pilus assembly ATPase PilB [unclassified Ketobacter]|uniref:type IV-A pilus assembly ATPase PilB n=1 Tax=unclassified Ketobacter TaxID=2639109 RepID=UPI000F213C18|nr:MULTISPECIES: type IV-A pilus assembly ATPase PilB [unclassified Ketobacter]RLT91393.1 MAG: type IV-A pilus assembly ATPase PilB [Ketobacter sp. GenoA1]RLT98173.1 MAG: type IV-A pilus assembly ATPase PilB [Ketobacter sp.]